MSVLIARVSGDNSAIREAIRDALPEVEVHVWHEEWQLPDGEDRAANATAHRPARKWLDTKKCDLLIAGRMKSDSVISLRFISAIDVPSNDDPATRPLTYTLATQTMDLPAKFADDVASSLGASIIVCLKTGKASSDVLQTLTRLTAQLQTVVDTAPALSDARIRASLINSYSIARAFIFEFNGNLEDLRLALDGYMRVNNALDRDAFPLEWSLSRSNYGAALARYGSVTNDTDKILEGIDAIKGVPALPSDIVRWTKVQLFLASAYLDVAHARGSMEYLSASLDVCLQVITEELREVDEGLWATAQDQYGRGLAMLGDAEAGTEALFRSVEAFTNALEVWTDDYPIMRAAVLTNMSGPSIALGARLGSLDWFNDTAARLREAQRMISKRHHQRMWLTIQFRNLPGVDLGKRCFEIQGSRFNPA